LTHRDFNLVRRVEALELAHRLPRRLPLLRCDCGFEVAELNGAVGALHRCPECGDFELTAHKLVMWPPGTACDDPGAA
jgi:hypothetical protein